jgi:hypothetical protein
MILHAPQIIWLALQLLVYAIAIRKHGQLEKDPKPVNVWKFLPIATIELALLYWGGFFSQVALANPCQ